MVLWWLPDRFASDGTCDTSANAGTASETAGRAGTSQAPIDGKDESSRGRYNERARVVRRIRRQVRLPDCTDSSPHADDRVQSIGPCSTYSSGTRPYFPTYRKCCLSGSTCSRRFSRSPVSYKASVCWRGSSRSEMTAGRVSPRSGSSR